MPHKRNPELGERVSGLARLIRGHSVTALENIALWHERDISHSSNERIILPDSCLTLDYILNLFTSVLSGLQVFPKRMKKNLELTRGLVFSQRVMLALISKGLSRQKAYELVQRTAMKAWTGNRTFLTLLKRDAEVMSTIEPKELESIFDYQYYLGYVNEIFNRLGLSEAQWRDKFSRIPPSSLGVKSVQSN
jgi:adenylosuccinate lyase